MELTQVEDKIKSRKVFTLVIDFWDYVPAKFSDLDKLLLKEGEKSVKISDKLLALEMIARRIEETIAAVSLGKEDGS